MTKQQTTETAQGGGVYTSGYVEQTQSLGEQIGRLLQAGDVVAFYGDLGSGKTTMIQGLAKGLGFDPDRIKSPTFVLMREYPGSVPLIHIDGYRLEGPAMVSWLDVEQVFSPSKITVIEWAERFESLLPESTLVVRMEHVGSRQRRIRLEPATERAKELIAKLPDALPEPPKPKKEKHSKYIPPDSEAEDKPDDDTQSETNAEQADVSGD